MYHCITIQAVLNNDTFSIESIDDFFLKKGEIPISIKRLGEENRTDIAWLLKILEKHKENKSEDWFWVSL